MNISLHCNAVLVYMIVSLSLCFAGILPMLLKSYRLSDGKRGCNRTCEAYRYGECSSPKPLVAVHP
ncbi:hypothetical protein P153DRAFT_13454 [Dothidotthia symphoricarpi CBS 119687]|uniref:Uncharacterized protein n=1 Tax=Dothidotthia symphoricarpi CBS 119687 TaxID=1392245 RepID=A0A6A6ATP3_9PLEO|nr:uncharacterized protein P153DRAFT_13454 [Dothidotthia symphoricarpi CBS 119687]KAF2134956.1 hypothetical protein P153DRAFT_13454 [Dothidotthia symphoricarpi CBS 119687]